MSGVPEVVVDRRWGGRHLRIRWAAGDGLYLPHEAYELAHHAADVCDDPDELSRRIHTALAGLD